MAFLKKLFGGGASNAADPVPYKDCLIFPEPKKDGGGYRLAARIEKTFGEETKTHQMIRADSYASLDEAQDAAVNKAKLVIDQLGDQIFDA